MKYLLSIVLIFTSMVSSAKTTDQKSLVLNTVMNHFSYTANYKKYTVTKDDIWNLQETLNDESTCLKTITGLVSVPSLYGRSTHQFWVCINRMANAELEAEVIDDVQIADE